jgi:hypothetical protein
MHPVTFCDECYTSHPVYVFFGFRCTECGKLVFPELTYPERSEDEAEELLNELNSMTHNDIEYYISRMQYITKRVEFIRPFITFYQYARFLSLLRTK